jgi:hypothetical protein
MVVPKGTRQTHAHAAGGYECSTAVWAVLSEPATASAGRDELGQWAIEPCELHRVYPPLTDDSDTGNRTGERAVTEGVTALLEANARASLLEQRINDLRTILDDMRGQRDDMREQRDA